MARYLFLFGKAIAMKTDTLAPEKKKAKKKTVKKEEAKEPKKDVAESYNRFKEYKGQQYTGMKVGRSHKWYYDQGVWKEKKITPDRWEFAYDVTKRRAGKAPEGSGVPVGTEYHWLIVADQVVRKLNANDYSTEMSGIKFKIAHKRFDKKTWSASDRAQHKALIKILKEFISKLEAEMKNEDMGNPEKLITE
jgi:hypothetical protein